MMGTRIPSSLGMNSSILVANVVSAAVCLLVKLQSNNNRFITHNKGQVEARIELTNKRLSLLIYSQEDDLLCMRRMRERT